MPKRYFFVHLIIFALLCGTFAIAGFSSYQDYLRSERRVQGRRAWPAAEEEHPLGARALALTGAPSTR